MCSICFEEMIIKFSNRYVSVDDEALFYVLLIVAQSNRYSIAKLIVMQILLVKRNLFFII